MYISISEVLCRGNSSATVVALLSLSRVWTNAKVKWEESHNKLLKGLGPDT